MPPDPEPKSIVELMRSVLLTLSNMLKGELALAYVEIVEKLHSTRSGLFLLAIALTLVPTLVGSIFATLVLALMACGFQPVWIALMATVVLSLIMTALVLRGLSLMRWGDISASRTSQSLRLDAQTLKEMMRNDASV